LFTGSFVKKQRLNDRDDRAFPQRLRGFLSGADGGTGGDGDDGARFTSRSSKDSISSRRLLLSHSFGCRPNLWLVPPNVGTQSLVVTGRSPQSLVEYFFVTTPHHQGVPQNQTSQTEMPNDSGNSCRGLIVGWLTVYYCRSTVSVSSFNSPGQLPVDDIRCCPLGCLSDSIPAAAASRNRQRTICIRKSQRRKKL
jgi:hypothetical protein